LGAVRTNEWYHVAAVAGRNGMKLFLDGGLLGTNSFTGGFSVVKSGARCRLGRSVVDTEPLVDGQLAEVRVWKAARTEAQIRQTMFQRLRAVRPGWRGFGTSTSWENDIVQDAGPGLHHGRLIGSAKIVQAEYPGSVQAVRSSKVLELDATAATSNCQPARSPT